MAALRRLGLGLLVGAILHGAWSAPGRAQGVPSDTTRRDSTRRDTLTVRGDTVIHAVPQRPDSIRVDSAKPPAPPRDTIKAPLTRAESPTLREIGPDYRWDRRALFASSAVTLGDLLARIPGLTMFQSGWITSPQTAAYLGDLARVRIFFDGLELDPLDPRTGGVHDLAVIQLWTLEEVAIERGPDEIRVHLRSWRTERTTPYTRTDVLTGDQDTNLYRGFFARRYQHGEALQLAAQQFSTDDPRSGAGGDALSLVGRLGFGRRGWSADAYVQRTHRTRSTQNRIGFGAPEDGVTALPSIDATHTEAYVRAGIGDPERGAWAQLVAGSLGFRESSRHSSATTTAIDTVDTLRSRAQYVAAGGFTRAGVRVSLTHRVRVFRASTYNSPSFRVDLGPRWATLGVLGEHSGVDSVNLGEASLRVTPLPFVSVAGAISARRPNANTGRPNTKSARAEAALRVGGGLWLIGGVAARDSATLAPPIVYDSAFARAFEGRVTGAYGAVRGRVWKAIYADMYGIRWQRPSLYRPQYQSRSQLYVQTDWLSRFPSGNFGFLFSGVHEYRSDVLFPTATGVEIAGGNRVISTLLEIRIVNAVLSWQFRNVLGELYQQVPGFEMPRQTNVYGVRWEFTN